MWLGVDGGGNAIAHPVTGIDGSFKFDQLSYDTSKEWHVRIEGVDSAEVLTLKIQPQTKYTVLFYEE